MRWLASAICGSARHQAGLRRGCPPHDSIPSTLILGSTIDAGLCLAVSLIYGGIEVFMRTLAILLLLSSAIFSQEFRGTFSGSVTDAQGAAIAKVKIVAIETRTGAKSEATSEVSGAYTIPFLAPGEYEITAEAPGFKKFIRQGVSLPPGEHPIIDIQLDVGAVTEVVTVTADSPLIENANSSIGQVITSDEVETMPTNGGTPLMLAQLALGAIPT